MDDRVIHDTFDVLGRPQVSWFYFYFWLKYKGVKKFDKNMTDRQHTYKHWRNLYKIGMNVTVNKAKAIGSIMSNGAVKLSRQGGGELLACSFDLSLWACDLVIRPEGAQGRFTP